MELMSNNIEKRIDQFESKMDTNFDKVTDILTKLARHDERVDDLERRTAKNEDDIGDLSKIVIANEHTAKSANRIFWIVFSAVVSFAFYLIKG